MERSFFEVVVSHATSDQNRPAIVSLGSDPLSFGALVAQIGQIWDTLRDGGVEYGSQVAIALPSGVESVMSTVTIASHATCVPLNPHLSLSEFERELARSNLDALIIPEWFDSPVRAAATKGSYGVFEASRVNTSL
jgi:acyl-CoA synthetase (AMP-forming)/AMP-acid ligase II